MLITVEQLLQVVPKARDMAATLVPELTISMPAYGIDSPPRIAAFIAQLSVESAQFTRLVENLNYSAQRLAAVWPNRFSDGKGQPNALALQLGGNPEAIANSVYADRLGNGPTNSGDGWRYRGRGLLQVTGRDNYRKVGVALPLDLEATPEWLEQPRYACQSAACFWADHGLNDLADRGDFKTITLRINGGLNGYDERVKVWELAKRVWPA